MNCYKEGLMLKKKTEILGFVAGSMDQIGAGEQTGSDVCRSVCVHVSSVQP